MAKRLPPESAAVEKVSREVGISVGTLERWRADAALSRPTGERSWTAVGRLEAVIATAPLNDTELSAWCREHGRSPSGFERWRDEVTQTLTDPGEAWADPGQMRVDRQRIRELERELRRKDKALAETAALRMLSIPVRRFTNVDDAAQDYASPRAIRTIVVSGV